MADLKGYIVVVRVAGKLVRLAIPGTSPEGALRTADNRLKLQHGFVFQDRELVGIEEIPVDDFFARPKIEEARPCPECGDKSGLLWPADLATHLEEHRKAGSSG